MKIYCLKCNAANEYTDIKPKFCGFCQHPFDSISSTLPSKSIKLELSDEDEECVYRDFNVKKIEIEPISKNLRPQQTFADVILEAPSNKKDIVRRPKPKKTSRRKFLEDWATELTNKTSREIGGE